MPDAQISVTNSRLSPKEQNLFDRIITKTGEIQGNMSPRFLYTIAFRFEVPPGFTQEEFDHVGRELTALRWDCDEIRRGLPGWSFILLPI